ncbi:polysaccharide biosynthesis tyrosine autokinase [Aestuariibius sp. HNIBRBA575]|uniref:polysaccharide biosynthesis tyrosine autokinase n=1 Tax=Aestuariibius sp. HNIBRBA575 TaxID=3233343 RepID=UPI0034A4275D
MNTGQSPQTNAYPSSVQTNDDDLIDLGQLLTTLWRGKLVIMLFLLIFSALSGYYAYRVATPYYRATTVLMLETEQQSIVDLTSVVSGLSGDTAELNSEIEVLRSRELLGRVAEVENLIADPEFNAHLNPPALKRQIKVWLGLESPRAEAGQERQQTDVVSTLLDSVSVRNVPNSFVFQVVVTSEDPRKAARLADQVGQQYILYQLDVKFEATQTASTWLSGRVAELQQELEGAEAEVSEFSANSELISPETLTAMENQLKERRDRLAGLQVARETASANLAALVAVQDGTPQQQADAADDAQLTALLPSDGSPVPTRFTIQFRQILSRAELQANRAQSQLQSVQDSIVTLEAEIASQGQDLIQLQQLTREAEASRLLYEYFLGRLKETSAQEGIQQADSRILSHAVVPREPAVPRKSLIVVMGAMLGGMLGVALVLIREMRSKTFRTSSELETFAQLPVMGAIPQIPGRKRQDIQDYLASKPASIAAEAVRNLRTSVLLSNVDNPPQVIMTTSSIPGEGKTTLSFALAQNLVGMGKSVLLIEGDVRRRTFTQYMTAQQERGLISVLSERCDARDAIQVDERTGVDVLMSEASNVNAADTLSSASFARFIADMRSQYDFVIIDTPPVLVVPDARIIAQHADAILFNVRWDKTSRQMVRDALGQLASVGAQVNGLVLNNINLRGLKRYGYGAYGTYGKKYYTN